MKKYAFIAIASVAFLTSCNDTKKETAVEEQAVATENAAAAIDANSTSAPAATAQAEGLNPEHGQPGHRCDIQVGQPLNTPVATQPAATATAAPAAAPQPFLVNDAAKAANTAATGNLNPAHGQPGHRCDIAVGQPLS